MTKRDIEGVIDIIALHSKAFFKFHTLVASRGHTNRTLTRKIKRIRWGTPRPEWSGDTVTGECFVIELEAHTAQGEHPAERVEEKAMENQHQKITGYRELSQDEINFMNEVKAKGAELGELVDRLKANPETDKRWVSIGATDLQTGLMALTRSIAKPTSF